MKGSGKGEDSMRYKLLGRSGLRVSELALGTMTFGEEWGWGASKEESQRIFDAYAEAGGNFIDTANHYTDGTSETVRRRVHRRRPRPLRAWPPSTRCATAADDPNAGGNHRKNMVQSLEASLRRLDTDYVDLLWVHAWDFITPVEEVMRGAGRSGARRQGALRRHLGYARLGGGAGQHAGRAARLVAASSGCRSATAWSTAPPSAICCRWPARSTSR